MSDLTDALTYALLVDLEGHLDAYQLSSIGTGAELWPDATPRQAAAWFLAHSLFKKYNDSDRPGKEASSAALAEFLSCNEDNANFQVQCNHLHEEELINDLSGELYNFWYVGVGRETPLVSCFSQLFERGKLGKGASRHAVGNDLYSKIFASPLSHTSEDLCFLWQRLSASNPRAFSAEENRSARFGFRQVEGNALSFVNKNVSIARGICTEPTINMWFQLGMASVLTDRLISRYDIRLDIQPEVNRAMARLGSVSGRFATIDMKSASDLISLNMAKRVFPKGMLDWFMLLRSPTTKLPSGRLVELHSVSTMGNGFTFPLMTGLFCAVITTVYRRLGIPVLFGNSLRRNFSVFGDDLIVVPEAVPLLYKLLGLLGFRVNGGKSFVEGPFRESCGADFYDGNRCRGVYIKRLQTSQDYAVAINALNRWSAVTGIILPSLVGTLLRQARRKGPVLWGPPDEDDDSCVHVPLDMARGVKRMSFGLTRYKKWISCVKTMDVNPETGQVASVDGVHERHCNPDGLYMAFLHGTLRGDKIALQAERPAYRTKHRVSASWDALSTPRNKNFGYGWRHWSSAVRWNLNSDGCVG